QRQKGESKMHFGDLLMLLAHRCSCLAPGVPVKFAREGKESLAFWLALGGKQDYTSKKLTQEIVREPHLFAIQSNKGKFEIEEVYSFEQDDLLTEDVMILDTHAEVIVWVGQSVDPKEKQNALATGQKYIDVAASAEGLCPHVPLFRVPEGSEPCFFTAYFSWDHAKTTVQGNSFTKKAMQLFGPGCTTESQDNKPQGNKSSGATQRASAMAALTSAFNSSSQTKTPIAPRIFTRSITKEQQQLLLFGRFLTAEMPDPGLLANNEEPSDTIDNSEVSEVADGTSEPNVETNEEDSSTKEADENENSGEEIQSSYTYDQLRSKSDNPVTGIDFKKRESYLSPEEFEEIFKMTKETFYNFPRWKQDQIKKKVDLF
ncbi:villin-2 isoform X1, partial [Tanacetum coccineum]